MSKNFNAEWISVISSDIDQLITLRLDQTLPSLYRYYAGAVLAFLQNNVAELRRLSDLKNHDEGQLSKIETIIIKSLITLRLKLRLNEVDIQLIDSLCTHCEKQHEDNYLNGEVFFVAAMSYEKLNNLHQAKLAYEKAQQELTKISCHKKALKCALNFLSCDSRLHTDQNYTADYENVYKQALLYDDYHSAGVALNNISQEYQRIQAPLVALKYVNDAIQIFENGGRRTVNYYLSYLQRCHILIQLSRKVEAYLDFQHCKISKFTPVVEAVKFLAPIFGENVGENFDSGKMTLFWQERVKKELSNPRLTSNVASSIENQFTVSEGKILELLSRGSLTRWEIIEHLYGKDQDPFVAENRIKVFLSKIRKKRPGLITLTEGRYTLSRDLYPELKIKAVK
ncbi:MAG: hypothetical protein ACXVCY_08730 [Pseudobdellovibrionaceae bacterium]